MSYRKYVIAAAVAAAALPAPAAAVTATSDATGKALILIPLTLTKIDDLEFGSVIPSPLSGTVTINATSGARTFAGGVTGAPGDIGKRGYFAGAGSPSQQVVIALTPPPELVSTTNSADKITVLGLTLDGSPIRTIDATRAFFFGIGGTIMLTADQPEGVYEATFDVTAVYL